MNKVKKFIKSNMKVVIAFILGISIAGSIGVYAATVINASSVAFSGSTSGLISTNLQDALNEAYTNAKSVSRCAEISGNAVTFKVGDYVKMTPISTSYTTDTSMTGYTSTQTINPSELSLWRVIRINSDKTVDMVSEYVSSVTLSFMGQTGYQNLVGYLNTIAHQYENSCYTVESRHMGYNVSTQTEYITDTTALTATKAPQSYSTPSIPYYAYITYEFQGLGDWGYETDYNLVNTALGTLVANKVGTTTAVSYWLASRHYQYTSSPLWYFRGRIIDTSGNLDIYVSLYSSEYGSFKDKRTNVAVRPIVTLKSGVKASSGDGSSSSPYVLS